MMSRITLLFFFFPFVANAQTVATISPNSGVTDALIFDADGNLLGADYTGSAVFKILLPGGESSVFSDGYNTPNGMALGSDGTLYLADNQGDKIYKIYPDSTREVFVEMDSPSGLIFELDSDTLIATSYAGDKLVKIAPDSSMTVWASGGHLGGGPVGLCYDSVGQLYVGNFDDRKIIKMSPDGSQELLVQGPTSGWLGFIAYAKGFIYGTLYSTHKIFRSDLQGNATVILGTTIGTVDGGPGVAKFSAPNGIVASPTGDTLYVSDYNTSNIRMITNLDGQPSAGREVGPAKGFNVSPNPFYGKTLLSFDLGRQADISLDIRDTEGRLVRQVLSNETLAAGTHQFEIGDPGLSSGIYFASLWADGEQVLTKRILRLD
ncbi:MAG: hypothetical protein R2830_03950 [Saprospiraceae bacterium]